MTVGNFGKPRSCKGHLIVSLRSDAGRWWREFLDPGTALVFTMKGMKGMKDMKDMKAQAPQKTKLWRPSFNSATLKLPIARFESSLSSLFMLFMFFMVDPPSASSAQKEAPPGGRCPPYAEVGKSVSDLAMDWR